MSDNPFIELEENTPEALKRKGEITVTALTKELNRRGVSLEQLGRLSRFSMWQSVTKDGDGEAHTHDLYGFRLSPSWEEGPKWPVITQGPALKVVPPRVTKLKFGDVRREMIAPDMQIGYYREMNGDLTPIHDESAIDLFVEMILLIRPHRIICVGDNLDLPEMSRYRTSPAFQFTTQPAIDYATELMGRMRSAAGPDCEIVWLAGNHEERLPNWIMDNAGAAFGLRQGQPTPDEWPVLSVPHLCRLEDVNVKYVPGYPASHIWINPNLKVIHGDRVRANGSTAHKYLAEQKVSIICGHIHRIEKAHMTRNDHDGPSEIMAASPGCLARITGQVPSTKQGLDLDGRPMPNCENWQQGFAVVTHDVKTEEFDYEQIRIDHGRAWWRGERYGDTNE